MPVIAQPGQFIPDNYKALKKIIQMELIREKWDNVLKNYGILRNSNGFETEFYFNPVIVLIRMNDLKSALCLLDEGLALQSDNPEFLFNRGALYLNLKKKQKGMKDLRRTGEILSIKKTNGTIITEEDQMLAKVDKLLEGKR